MEVAAKELEDEQVKLFSGSVSTVFPDWKSDLESLEESEFDRETPEVTVVVPTLNEESNIDNAVRQLHGSGFRNVLVIDGNSSDRTVEIAKDLGANIAFQSGKGKGAALRQAFMFQGIGDSVVMMDADGSMDPKEIYRLLEPLKKGADIVKGSRFLGGGFSEDMTPFRIIGNWIFVFLVNWLWGARYTDLCYGFAAFKKSALDKLCPCLESAGFEIETELFLEAKRLGLKVVEIPSVEKARKHGVSNLNAFRDGLSILRTIIRKAILG